EDLAGLRRGVVGAGGHLDSAGLPASAGLHLRLHDDTPAEPLRGVPCLLRAGGNVPVEDRHAMLGEDLSCLVFEQIHGLRPRTWETVIWPQRRDQTAGRNGGAPVWTLTPSLPRRETGSANAPARRGHCGGEGHGAE